QRRWVFRMAFENARSAAPRDRLNALGVVIPLNRGRYGPGVLIALRRLRVRMPRRCIGRRLRLTPGGMGLGRGSRRSWTVIITRSGISQRGLAANQNHLTQRRRGGAKN